MTPETVAMQETIKQLYAYRLERNDLIERIARLHSSMTSCTATMSDAPKGGNPGDKMSDYVIKIQQLESQLTEAKSSILHTEYVCEAYIESVDDSTARLLMRYKYLDGMSWAQVARKLGGGNTREGVRKIVQRALK